MATPAAWLCVRMKGEQKSHTIRSQVAVVKRESSLPSREPTTFTASGPDVEFVGGWWEGQKCRGIWIGILHLTQGSGQTPC